MERSDSERLIVVACAAVQSLVAMLIVAVVTNVMPQAQGERLAVTAGVAALVSVGVATLVASAGGNEGVVKVGRYLLWVPMLLLASLLVIAPK